MWFSPAVVMQNSLEAPVRDADEINERVRDIEAVAATVEAPRPPPEEFPPTIFVRMHVRPETQGGKGGGGGGGVAAPTSHPPPTRQGTHTHTHTPKRQGIILEPLGSKNKKAVDAWGWELLEEEDEDGTGGNEVVFPDLLLLCALPMEAHDSFELVSRGGAELQAAVRDAPAPLQAVRLVRRACAEILEGPTKLKSLNSVATRNRVRDIIVLSNQEALLQARSAHENADGDAAAAADRFAKLIENIGHLLAQQEAPKGEGGGGRGGFEVRDLQYMLAMTTLARCMAMAFDGEYDAAQQELLTAIASPAYPDNPKLKAILHLNRSTVLSQLGRHKAAFDASYSAWKLIEAAGESDDWFCYSPAHSQSELTRHPWHQFAAFAKLQLSQESLRLGFDGPCIRFVRDAEAFMSKGESPRQIFLPCQLLTSTIRAMSDAGTKSRALGRSILPATAPETKKKKGLLASVYDKKHAQKPLSPSKSPKTPKTRKQSAPNPDVWSRQDVCSPNTSMDASLKKLPGLKKGKAN